MSSRTDQFTDVTRWVLRLLGIALISAVLIMGVSALFGQDGRRLSVHLLATRDVLVLILWGVIVGSLLAALAWEGPGGGAVALAALALQTDSLLRRSPQVNWLASASLLVGLAFVGYWWRVRHDHRAVATTTHGPESCVDTRRFDGSPSAFTELGPLVPRSGVLPAGEQRAGDGERRAQTRGLILRLPRQPRRVDLDVIRARIECGPGGDIDADGHLARRGHGYVPGLKPTISAWVQLNQRVLRGEVGGADDGLTDSAATFMILEQAERIRQWRTKRPHRGG